jgi:polyphosphate kinase 2 (PPK2 family)
MAKDKGKKKGKKAKRAEVLETAPVENPNVSGEEAAAEGPRPPMSAKEFDKEMKKLQVELVKMQEWVKVSGARICVLFEGRDTAGKGGVIRRITERVSPRVFHVVALSAPTEREK